MYGCNGALPAASSQGRSGLSSWCCEDGGAHLARSPVYQDEQEVRLQYSAGSANVCYDILARVPPLRFWLIQACLSSFRLRSSGVYVLHKGAEAGRTQIPWAGGCLRGTMTPQELTQGQALPDGARLLLGLRGPPLPPDLDRGSFDAALPLFGWSPEVLLHTLLAPAWWDCYVSRPTEKSILMLFVWAMCRAVLCLLSPSTWSAACAGGQATSGAQRAVSRARDAAPEGRRAPRRGRGARGTR